ncbi:hypothetical protein OGAPHI_001401 [Ogataea philodendri]|uniref:DNA replication ATP-dependent helicase/nuclease n=1 Tax=Ogataea philodendri TaxID=1378263 RepID=A0A9P8PCW7_9ASCO|nr:uncharacterized protein OGAPHI_001401 [Ogataea philodendri]KAH3669280.1 hypothetical protein OGAPHI_001401 [Ogataea philodendri]
MSGSPQRRTKRIKPSRNSENSRYLDTLGFTEPLARDKAVFRSVKPSTESVPLQRKDPNICSSTNSDIQLSIKTPDRKGSKMNSELHHPSSDDNIFWALTPSIKKNKDNSTTTSGCDSFDQGDVLSSPIHEALTGMQLLDPKLKSLLEKYDMSNDAERTPSLARSVSDPHSLVHKSCVAIADTPIIAKKQTLSESMQQSISKLKASKRLVNGAGFGSPSEAPTQSVSQMLTMIGKTIREETQTELQEESQQQSVEVDYLLDDLSDEFSDVDMEELDQLSNLKRTERATAEPEEKHEDVSAEPEETVEAVVAAKCTQASTSFDTSDDFSDNGDEIFASSKDSSAIPQFKDMKLENDNQQAFEVVENPLTAEIHNPRCHRYRITNVVKSKYKGGEQLILKCENEGSQPKNLVVRDLWTELEYQEGDIVNVIVDSVNPQLIDKSNNMLIWNPDILLSATMVASAVDCKRKAVLSNKLQSLGEHSTPLILGSIVHQLFQACLKDNVISTEFIDEYLEELLDENLVPIYSIGIDRSELKGIILGHVDYIKEWVSKFTSANTYRNNAQMKVSNVLDIEENIWSPMFGLKGLIDVVIEASLKDGSKVVVPMEIKTGKDYISNRAQATLYTLLVSQRYNVQARSLALVYTKMRQSYFEALNANDLRMLVNIRNHISHYLRYGAMDLPPLKKQPSCERCFSLNECMTYNKLMENGTAKDSGIEEELYESLTGHLNKQVYLDFFSHWNNLLSKEEGFVNSFKKDLWCYSASVREQKGGKAAGHLQVTHFQEVEVSRSHTKRYLYTFERDDTVHQSLTATQLSKHDRVIVSDEEGQFGLAFGFVENVRPGIILVSTDRRFVNSNVKMSDFDANRNQVFQSVLTSGYSQELPAKTYRIDKDEMFHGLNLARFNLLNLFLAEGDERTRKLVVDLDPPRFSKTTTMSSNFSSKKFNPDQLQAFDKVLRTEDYCLVLGMPGTGKTTVTASLIKCLVENGKSVLIASYTHSAVDNILEKLVDIIDEPKILRVGAANKLSEKVRKYSLYSKDSIYALDSAEGFQKAFFEPNIVATTCLGIQDTVFIHRQHFDYCIIDEASQVSMPVCLGPLRFADKFVLVGDHFQLPPLVRSPEARVGGMDRSLFRILSEKYPESVVELTHQYRMSADVMMLSNSLIYDGRLKCGSLQVANQILPIPQSARLEEFSSTIPKHLRWMDHVFKPTNRVVFLSHDNVPAQEVANGEKIDNPVEAQLILQIIKCLVSSGVDASSIGVMSFYRAQLRHFYRGLSNHPDIEVLTADQFQGRDKNCIIISLVRSNEKNVAGDLLREWRRVNVAMTRAKSKLIILGSEKLMKTIPQFEGFMNLLENRRWVYSLPPDADAVYQDAFKEFMASQMNSMPSSNRSVKMNTQSRVIQKTMVLKNVLQELS